MEQLSTIVGKVAATHQYTLELVGSRSNTTEPPEMRQEYQRLEEMRSSVKGVYRRLNRLTKISQMNTEEGRELAFALKNSAYVQDQPLRDLLSRIAEFQLIMEDLRSGMDDLISREISAPLKQFIKSEVREARDCKKKFDRVRLNYETSLVNLRQISKKQKVNLNKVLEAEERKNEWSRQFDSISEETMEMIQSSLEKNDLQLFELLLLLMDAYKIYFDRGSEWIKGMNGILEDGRAKALEKKKAYEQQQAIHQLNRLKRKEKSDRAKKLSASGKTIFGVSLEDIKERDGEDIPSVIEVIFKRIRMDPDLEGIFRISPSKAQQEVIKEKIDQGKAIDFSSFVDPHLAPGLLKMYLRDLPKPLMTFELYGRWLELSEIESETIFKEKMNALLSELPPANRKLLTLLLDLCSLLVQHTDKNMMTSKNLAIVLAPNILYQRAENFDPSSMATQMAKVNLVFSLMIDSYQKTSGVAFTSRPKAYSVSNPQRSPSLLNTVASRLPFDLALPLRHPPPPPAPPLPVNFFGGWKAARAKARVSGVSSSAGAAIPVEFPENHSLSLSDPLHLSRLSPSSFPSPTASPSPSLSSSSPPPAGQVSPSLPPSATIKPFSTFRRQPKEMLTAPKPTDGQATADSNVQPSLHQEPQQGLGQKTKPKEMPGLASRTLARLEAKNRAGTTSVSWNRGKPPSDQEPASKFRLSQSSQQAAKAGSARVAVPVSKTTDDFSITPSEMDELALEIEEMQQSLPNSLPASSFLSGKSRIIQPPLPALFTPSPPPLTTSSPISIREISRTSLSHLDSSSSEEEEHDFLVFK